MAIKSKIFFFNIIKSNYVFNLFQLALISSYLNKYSNLYTNILFFLNSNSISIYIH